MKLTNLADHLAQLANNLANQLPERLHAIRDAMGGTPGGHTYDVIPTPRTVLWCWQHERDITQCRNRDLDCDGETMIINDPTGEAAVTFDPARRDRAELERHIRKAHHHLDRANAIIATYADKELTVDRAGIGRCTDCNRYCDGTGNNRLSHYKGGDPICPGCRAGRDRKSVNNTNPQVKCLT